MRNKWEEHQSERETYSLLSYRCDENFGSFFVEEDKNGQLNLEVQMKGGTKIDLKKYVPAGYRVIGNKILWEDPRYMGLYNTDTSICDQDTKTIVISERELRKDGWKFILVLFHEFGHAARDEQHPEKRKERDSIRDWTENPHSYKCVEQFVSEDERDAWAFSIRTFRVFVKESGLSIKDLFPNAAALRDFVRKESLEIKAIDAIHSIDRFEISPEEKEKLWEEIIEMYLGKQTE